MRTREEIDDQLSDWLGSTNDPQKGTEYILLTIKDLLMDIRDLLTTKDN